MANGSVQSSLRRQGSYGGNEVRDSASNLNVLRANLFEGQTFAPEFLRQTEERFYRGAPPVWLNFHISEQAESKGLGTPLIKRDGYDKLVKQIQEKKKRREVSTVKLFHQPGCGGTTLAMQVLWDLRKKFRCAILTDSAGDVTNVANDVVRLFTAGRRRQYSAVLLLLNDDSNLEDLQDSIMAALAEQNVIARVPVAILLSCVRKEEVQNSEHVNLRRELSDTEREKFDEKKEELSREYSHQHQQFHGFNILQTNFSPDYIRQACTDFPSEQRAKRAQKTQKTQLAGFLALLNAYVPGSYLLESQCQDFLKKDRFIRADVSLEGSMQPFNHLFVVFQQDERSERRVRMAHSMIAETCIELMSRAGATRSDTAINFLNSFCRGDVPSSLHGFVKDMLTKREIKREETVNDNIEPKDRERFSRLILDIQSMEEYELERGRTHNSSQSASVLKVASENFEKNAYFPQALARVYYLELKNYKEAEKWAKVAKERSPQRSFVADTLGQVYKNHLRSIGSTARPEEILKLAVKAIEAFKDEEELAKSEHGQEMEGEGMTIWHFFNTRGQYGYLQVCNIVYDVLVDQNPTWKRVLTKEVSMSSVLTLLGDSQLCEFDEVIQSLRDDVERRSDFFNAFLTYSRPGIQKMDKPYIRKDVFSCHYKYTGLPLPDLVKEIKKKLSDGAGNGRPVTDADPPEAHIAAFFRAWPAGSIIDLIQNLDDSYEHEYAAYYRSRYLYPLLYLGKGGTEDSIIPTRIEDILEDEIDVMIKERIFRHLLVQQSLVRFRGVIRNYSIVATVGDTKVRVKANSRDKLWVPRDVSFYLGFTISGLTAFDIETEKHENDKRETITVVQHIENMLI
ncbi:sterile alpha motif domain-containing protein 9-like [Echeneis naucrates]|uniref:Sterile alpha motif domain-containing protein 9-like n=1 Tax=Echeneis naucrates TaxID=173247 RepID=A0A665VGW2_ECHNA|nr:sterile alpha motif domain-containing protein 9-like [Echeneis naucrates]